MARAPNRVTKKDNGKRPSKASKPITKKGKKGKEKRASRLLNLNQSPEAQKAM
jgi:hypothetical protein